MYVERGSGEKRVGGVKKERERNTEGKKWRAGRRETGQKGDYIDTQLRYNHMIMCIYNHQTVVNYVIFRLCSKHRKYI